MAGLQNEDTGQLFEMIKKARSGPAQAVNAGMQGYDTGVARGLEERKQALAAEIAKMTADSTVIGNNTKISDTALALDKAQKTQDIIDPMSQKRVGRIPGSTTFERVGPRGELIRAGEGNPGGSKPVVLPNQPEDKTTAQQQGKETLEATIAALGAAHDKLKSMGAAVSTEQSGGEHASSYVRPSAPGQFFGSVAGTTEQATRSEIKTLQPLLLQQIRQATGMGARGLDSDKELQFYLAAATNPSMPYETNMAALRVLSAAYGNNTRGLPKLSTEEASKLFHGGGGASSGKGMVKPSVGTSGRHTYTYPTGETATFNETTQQWELDNAR
jgi:hypothetical protein